MFLAWNMSAEILTVTNTNDSGTGSLRRMVEIANPGDSIIFDKSLTGKTINLQSDISITNSNPISGKNASVTISGANISGAKSIDNLTFIQSGISNCILVFNCNFSNYTGKFGAVYNSQIINNCIFKNNGTQNIYMGGTAVYISDYVSPTITNCAFENNLTASKYGAIFISGYSLETSISDCIFNNNSSIGFADAGGAAITMNGSSAPTYATITNCIFNNNRAIKAPGFLGSFFVGGGAILIYSTISTITNCTFNNNSVTDTISNSNPKKGGGGAIYYFFDDYSSYRAPTISNCSFNNNSTTGIDGGGAIFISGSNFPIINCTFNDNNATENGGAISGGNNIVKNCTFYNNSANNGGAIYNSKLSGNLFIYNKIMPDNILNDAYKSTSQGYNVYTSNQNTVFSQSTDYRYAGTQSLLVPLGNYGGDTPTMPINTSVLNWETIVRRVPVSKDRTTDQRGFTLPTTGLLCAGSVEMQPNEHYTGINEIKKESVNVYPNPTNDIIHFNLEENLEVQLYDALGKLVKAQSGKVGSNEINIKDFPQGVYFLNVSGKATKIMKK